MRRVKISKERCKSCGLCIRECPKHAIDMSDEYNAKGYRIVTVDDAVCIQCGICYHICPDCVFEVVEVDNG